MKRFGRLIFLLIILATLSPGQNHFTPVDTTGLPYIIVVTGVNLNDVAWADSCEIGIYDDTLCVGLAVFNGADNLQITAWEGSESLQLPGFTAGHPILYKIWMKAGTDFREFDAVPEYTKGDGTFGFGSYSVASLSAYTVAEMEHPVRIIKDNILTYPNPFNNSTSFEFQIPAGDQFLIKIFSLTGSEIFSDRQKTTKTGMYRYNWNAKTNSGKDIPGGTYLVVISTDYSKYCSKITYLK